MDNSIGTTIFEEQFFIDKDCTTILHTDDATFDWFSSSTRTTTIPKMQLKKHRQSPATLITRSPSKRDRNFERRAAACRQTSTELQHRLAGSVSSTTSNPGLTDCSSPSTSPSSDTSFEDVQSHNPSIDLENQIWSEYPYDDIKGTFFESPNHNFTPENHTYSYPTSHAQYSPRCRSPISADTYSPQHRDLHRSDAVRATRDRSRTVNARVQPHNIATETIKLVTQPQAGHDSWPQRKDSRTRMTRPTRPRAYTAPSQPEIIRPATINVCVPLKNDLQYIPPTSSLLAHRSAPPTPFFLASLQQNAIVEDVSCFEDDDDQENRPFFGSLSRLYRRGSSVASGSLGKKSTLDKKPKHVRKSLSEVFGRCFGKCK